MIRSLPCFSQPVPATAIELLASLLGQRYAFVARMLESSVTMGSHTGSLVVARRVTIRKTRIFFISILAEGCTGASPGSLGLTSCDFLRLARQAAKLLGVVVEQ